MSVIARGLSMPHSPRWYRDQLWLCNAGTGEFGSIDLTSGQFQPLTFCPGFMRGLAFFENYAVIGVSKPRENRTFNGLALNQQLSRRNLQSMCGLLIVDLSSGVIEHSIQFQGLIHALYDILVLSQARNPKLLGFRNEEIDYTISIDQ